MTKLISMPTSPWFIDSSFTLTRAVGITSSPFSGKQRTQEFDFVGWEGTANLPPMNRTQAVEWQAFLLECIGTRNYFNFIVILFVWLYNMVYLSLSLYVSVCVSLS